MTPTSGEAAAAGDSDVAAIPLDLNELAAGMAQLCRSLMSDVADGDPVDTVSAFVSAIVPGATVIIAEEAPSDGSARVSHPLQLTGRPGMSLHLATGAAGEFEAPSGEVMALIASAVSLALSLGAERRRADQLESALANSRRIGAAVGILMSRYRWTDERAFQTLRTASQSQNRKLRDLAETVVLTGDLPSESGAG